MSGLPKTVILTPDVVREAIEENVKAIIESVSPMPRPGAARAGAGPDRAGHPSRRRRHAARPRQAHRRADSDVHLVDAPLECVVLGAGKCLESFDSLKVMFMGAER